MEISFFEEFTTQENLERIKLIDFPTKLYIAAHNLPEFQNFKGELPVPLIYWLVLKKSEGYWISPFSKRHALLRSLNETRDEKIELMLDLENPVHAPWLYLTELYNFSKNKRFLQEFIEHSKPEITLVELPGDEKRLKFWGLAYDSKTASVVKMAYTSFFKLDRKKGVSTLKRICKQGVKKYGSRFKIGLGCIAHGVSGIEPILSPQELDEDLHIAKENEVSEAIIFRLGGLTKDYINKIKYLKNKSLGY